ncbi:hypothetical protein FB45DRAFT_1012236 [Roridomyces roridus]|uniref:Uncharacterized protein n=1 Tax=Roridomyces roridus TaxID=1738132 RepID=A0AAD7B0H9_9AGAR|nr:hypothetical protein FB45DRAFT_1012236 [Roridomyces roridus]
MRRKELIPLTLVRVVISHTCCYSRLESDTSNVAQAKTEFDWQAWNIEGNAISELQKWGAGHENSKWRKLADAIDHCLKSKTLEAVQDFIPDRPVPVKTLVKALLSIVQLGISANLLAQNVPVIQKKVYDFAQEAIEYIRTLVGILGGWAWQRG